MQKTSLVVAFFLAAVLAGVFVNFGLLKAPAPAQKETFMQQSIGMPLSSGGMGPYDSVSLAGGFSGWGATEAAPILDGAPAGTSSGLGVTAISVNANQITTCTFTNTFETLPSAPGEGL